MAPLNVNKRKENPVFTIFTVQVEFSISDLLKSQLNIWVKIDQKKAEIVQHFLLKRVHQKLLSIYFDFLIANIGIYRARLADFRQIRLYYVNSLVVD